MVKKKSGNVETEDFINRLREEAGVAGLTEEMTRIENTLSTGIVALDKVVDGGRNNLDSGIPAGRQTEFSGPEGVGKTTAGIHLVVEAQRRGWPVIVCDTEKRIDIPYWTKLGANCQKIIPLRGDYLEEIYNKQRKMLEKILEIDSSTPCLLFWDSLGSASLRDIMEGEDPNADPMEIATKLMGKKARVNSAGLELINPILSKTNCAYVYTNHVYSKLNVRYGSPITTGGGQKPKYFATLRIQFTNVGRIVEKDEYGNETMIGQEVEIEALKNSMSPFRLTKRAAILGDKGFSNDYSVWLTCMRKGGPIAKGAWSTCTFSDGEEVKFQGWRGFQEKLIVHPKYQELVDHTKLIL
jgi:recombination protein RecA